MKGDYIYKIERDFLRDILRSKDVWMRRALVGQLVCQGKEVPEFLKEYEEWIRGHSLTEGQ